MSVLRDRIVSQGGQGGGAEYHPHGTGATPMVMPLAVVEYNGEDALYQTLHPLYATDPVGGAIPGRPFYWAGDGSGHGWPASQGYNEQARAGVYTADGART